MHGKRSRLALAGVVLIAIVIIGVLVRSRSGGPILPDRNGEDGADTLHILGEASANLAALQLLSREYKDSTGTVLDFQAKPFEELTKEATSDFVSQRSRYDLVLDYNFALSSYVRNGFVYNLKEATDTLAHATSPLTRAAIPGIIQSTSASLFARAWKEVGWYIVGDGAFASAQPIALPFATNSMLLVANRQLFEDRQTQERFRARFKHDLQLPTTWEEFRRVAEFFTDSASGRYGVVMQGASGGWLYYEWANFAYSFGGGVMRKEYGWEGDAHTPLRLTDSATIAATEFYLSLRPYAAPGYLRTDAPAQRDSLRTGRYAMAIMWTDYLYDLVFEPGGHSHALDYLFAPIPGDRSMLAGGGFFINRRSKHPEKALSFVLFALDSARQSRMMVEKGLSSPVVSAYTPEVRSQLPYADALAKSLERGTYMNEAGPDAVFISNEITDVLQQAWRGQLSARAAMVQATHEIERGRVALFLKR